MATDRREQNLSDKEQLTERWVHRRLGKVGHERRVLDIATTLFDLTHAMHGLGVAHRRLLRLGAMLHDVGRSVEDRRHPSIGAGMIMEDAALPISNQDRRRLAYLTRHHRGAVPQVGYDDFLRSSDGRKSMRRLLAILRAADSLDNRNMAPPRIVLTLRGNKLGVTCFIEEDCNKARKVFSRRKKFRLLEELLDCRIDVQIKRAQAVHAV